MRARKKLLAPVQKIDLYEHLKPFLPAPVHVMDLYKHLYKLKEIRIFTYKIKYYFQCFN